MCIAQVAWLALGCGAPQSPSDGRPGAAPRAVRASSDRVAEAARGVEGAGLGLEAFEPLLAAPGLERAARSVELGLHGDAANEVSAVIAVRRPEGLDGLRWHFLLGRLREAEGRLAEAAMAYARAGAAPWALRSYAQLGQARCLGQLGKPRDALSLLPDTPEPGPIGLSTLLVRGAAARALHDDAAARDAFRKALVLPGLGADLPAVALGLAESLLECGTPATAAPLGAVPSVTGAPGVSGPLGFAITPPGEAGAPGPEPSTTPCTRDAVVEALAAVRRVLLTQQGTDEEVAHAKELEQRALGLLGTEDRKALEPLSIPDQVTALTALVDRRRFEEARASSDALLQSLGSKDRDTALGCEAQWVGAKALAGTREWGKASEMLERALPRCGADLDRRARMLFLAAKYADADGRQMKAIEHYAALEREVPGHRLADDARLNGAKLWLERDVEARFTEMLSRMPDDYPEGDMMLDGVFTLAARRMEKGDWSGAANVLERAAALIGGKDVARGQEFSGRERYFLARARMELGQKERGLEELVSIVRELPLSYYMLQAYSRLAEDDPHHARTVLSSALERATEAPFTFKARPELQQPGFQRAVELLRVGDASSAKRELEASNLTERSQAPEVLWAVALLYERAGVASLGHSIARGLLSDWLGQWPAGEWSRAWQIAFPRPYYELVSKEAKKNGIPEYLAYAIMREESGFQPTVESPAAAYGLMQIIVPTARSYARPLNLPWSAAALKRPSINIALGCRILGDLSTKFDQNPLLAIPGYNAGPGRPRRWVRERPNADFDVWVERIPIRETHRYMKRVLASRATYAFLYHPGEAESALRLPTKVGR